MLALELYLMGAATTGLTVWATVEPPVPATALEALLFGLLWPILLPVFFLWRVFDLPY